MTVSRRLIAMVVVSSVPQAVLAAAVEQETASGWIERGGQRFVLKYAFAAMDEDVLEGPGKEKVEVLLSDKPVPAEMRKAGGAWTFWAGEQSRNGELHGVILYITPETKAWTRGQLLSKNGLMFYSHTVSSPEMRNLVFVPASSPAGTVAGKVSMKKPMEGMEESGGAWRVEAEFHAVVLQRPAVTGSLTGEAARRSEPYKTVEAYFQACRKKDFEAIKRLMNANAQTTLAQMAARGKTELLEMLAAEAAETSKLELTRVTVRGDTAEVEFSGDGKQVMSVVLEGGIWKIGQ